MCWLDFSKYVKNHAGWKAKRREATAAEKTASGEKRQSKCYFVDVIYSPTKTTKKQKQKEKEVAIASSPSSPPLQTPKRGRDEDSPLQTPKRGRDEDSEDGEDEDRGESGKRRKIRVEQSTPHPLLNEAQRKQYLIGCKIPALKELCKANNLKVSGRKGSPTEARP